ncbi:MAG: thiamine phosphate synthase [Desulfamplus sp.]|nr:thiamine phosphate synthase [Desulfamplus sp.]
MLIAIIQNSETTRYEHMDSVKIALAKGADVLIFRGFEGRYNGVFAGRYSGVFKGRYNNEFRNLSGERPSCNGSLKLRSSQGGSSVSTQNAKLLVNALPDERWLRLKPDGFHLNRYNLEIVLKKPELIELLRKSAGFFGASVHNKEEITRALLLHQKIPVSYLLVSPLFKPSYDQMAETLGIDGFKALYDNLTEECNKARIPRPRAIALGGINKDSAKELMPYNFIEGVAAMSAIGDLPDEVIERWREPMSPWSNL